MVASHEPALSSELLDLVLGSFKFCCVWYPQASLPHRDEGRRVMSLILLAGRCDWMDQGWTTGSVMQDVSHLKELCCPDMEQTGAVSQRWPEHAMVEHQV